LVLITDSFCPKHRLANITGGRVVELDKPPGIKTGDLTKEFPNGFVLKPVWGWGSKDVYFLPMGQQYGWLRKHALVDRKFLSQTLKNGSDELVARWGKEWLIQPFFAPEQICDLGVTEFRIWRIFAVRPSLSEPFQLLGGLWNQRRSLRVHGASNTTNGLIVMEGKERKPTEIHDARRKSGPKEEIPWGGYLR